MKGSEKRIPIATTHNNYSFILTFLHYSTITNTPLKVNVNNPDDCMSFAPHIRSQHARTCKCGMQTSLGDSHLPY